MAVNRLWRGRFNMRRRELITLLGGAAAWPLAARAQAPNAVRHVGVLSPFSPSFGPSPAFQAFRQTFHDRGWIEGRNIVLHYRWAEGHADRLPKLAAELAELKPDLLFSVWGTPSALAAKNATIRIPIVFAGVGDAIGVGLVASLARPGGNVTGSTFISEETIAKQVEFLKEAVPALARVAILVNPANPVYGPILEATGGPAKALDLHLQHAVADVLLAHAQQVAAPLAGIERQRQRQPLPASDCMMRFKRRDLDFRPTVMPI